VLGINSDPVTTSRSGRIVDRAGQKAGSSATARVPHWKSVASSDRGLPAARGSSLWRASRRRVRRADRTGGLLRYGIPEFKMEKRLLERRIRR
jgi:glutamate synthase (NADPH/NADH) small chain